MRSRALVLSLGLAFLLASMPHVAQLPTGTVSGKVTSAEGEALPGVTVTVSSPSLQGSGPPPRAKPVNTTSRSCRPASTR